MRARTACSWRLKPMTRSSTVRRLGPSCRVSEPGRSMTSNRSVTAAALVCLVFASGCRQDMHNQPKYKPLRPSALFADGSSARPLLAGTVARGTLQEDEAFFTGKMSGATVKELPFQITEADLNRGEERFNIFCTPCHDKAGTGKGMVVQRGYRMPPSFH